MVNSEIMEDSYALHHFKFRGIRKSIEEGTFISGQLSNAGIQQIEGLWKAYGDWN